MSDNRPDIRPFQDLPKYLKDKIVADAGSRCWIWTGWSAGEYGKVRHNDEQWMAARAVYDVLVRGGVAKSDRFIHSCGNKRCVNPEHMEVSKKRKNGPRQRNRGNPGPNINHRKEFWNNRKKDD